MSECAFLAQILRNCRVFPRRLTIGGGGFLTIGYCLRTVGHCFP